METFTNKNILQYSHICTLSC